MAIDPTICNFVRTIENRAAIEALGGINLVGLLRLNKDGSFHAFVPDVEGNEVSVTPLDPDQRELESAEHIPMFVMYDRSAQKYTVCLRSCDWGCDEFATDTGSYVMSVSSHCNAKSIIDSSVVSVLGGEEWLCILTLQTGGIVEVYFPDVSGNKVHVRASDPAITQRSRMLIERSIGLGVDHCLRIRDEGVFPLYVQPSGNAAFKVKRHDGATNNKLRLIRKILEDIPK